MTSKVCCFRKSPHFWKPHRTSLIESETIAIKLVRIVCLLVCFFLARPIRPAKFLGKRRRVKQVNQKLPWKERSASLIPFLEPRGWTAVSLDSSRRSKMILDERQAQLQNNCPFENAHLQNVQFTIFSGTSTHFRRIK